MPGYGGGVGGDNAPGNEAGAGRGGPGNGSGGENGFSPGSYGGYSPGGPERGRQGPGSMDRGPDTDQGAGGGLAEGADPVIAAQRMSAPAPPGRTNEQVADPVAQRVRDAATVAQEAQQEIGFSDVAKAFASPLIGGLALMEKHMANRQAVTDAAATLGVAPAKVADAIGMAWGAGAGAPLARGEGGRQDDTLPGDAGAPDTGKEEAPDPDGPGAVFADVTPWEGVPAATQALLPQGWLGQAQGNILTAHQSAARMGAW